MQKKHLTKQYSGLKTKTSQKNRNRRNFLNLMRNILKKFCCCCCWVASVVSDSARPHRWQPTRLPHPWDSPGKNTRVGCHFLLQCMKVKCESEVAQLCPTQQPHGLQPTRLLGPSDFPGKSTGVGCHCLLRQKILHFILYLKVKEYSPPPAD